MSIASLAIIFVALLFVVAFILFLAFEPTAARQHSGSKTALPNAPSESSVKVDTLKTALPDAAPANLASLDVFVQSQGDENKKAVKKKQKKQRKKNKVGVAKKPGKTPSKSASLAPKERRRHWEKLLSGEEKNQHDQARKYLAEGQDISAAKLFESLGMVREAVDAYEKAGFYAQGAQALMRINRPHRAGIIFARGEMWADAAKCFVAAEMHEEAAKCYVQTGQFEEAANAYMSVEDFVNAANAYAKVGKFRKAAHAFDLSGDKLNATRQLRLALSSESSLGQGRLTEAELALVQKEGFSTSESSETVFKALHGDPRLPAMIEGFLLKKDFVRAEQLYKFADTDTRSSLIGKAVDGKIVQDDLIHLLRKVKDHLSLGYILQKTGQSAQAGYEFEQAREWDLAISNYVKAGSTQEVERVSKAKVAFESGAVVSLQAAISHEPKSPVRGTQLLDMRIFQNVNKVFTQKVEAVGTAATLRAGDRMQSGLSGHKFVNFVVSGSMALVPVGGASEQVLNRGDSFGYQTLMGFSSGQTTYVATSDAKLLQVDIGVFKRMLDEDGISAQQVLKNCFTSLPEYRTKIS